MRPPPAPPAALIPEVLPEAPGRISRPLPGRALSRREVYLLALPVLALALVPGWLVGTPDPFDRLAVPALAGLLAGVFVALWLSRWRLESVLTGLLGGVWLYLLGRIAFVLSGPPDAAQLGALGSAALWVPALLVAHIWMLGNRAGRRASRLALGALLSVLAASALRQPALLGAPASALLVQSLLAGLMGLIGQRSALQRVSQEVRRHRLGEHLTGRGDSLTGLPDARLLQEWLRRAPPRRLSGLAVAALRVEPPVTGPHDPGPYDPLFAGCLTAHVGRVLEGALRDQDMLGRVGGADFLVLLRVPDERAARAACERLRLRVAARPLEGVNSSLSVGLAFYRGQADGLTLLREAQAALEARCAQRQTRTAETGQTTRWTGPAEPSPEPDPAPSPLLSPA
ncbi:GGDEF domain-containing protein [Deinococcus koreensis]|nr:diguanylate cyclase [Deinococcus koreensis]